MRGGLVGAGGALRTGRSTRELFTVDGFSTVLPTVLPTVLAGVLAALLAAGPAPSLGGPTATLANGTFRTRAVHPRALHPWTAGAAGN